MSGACPYADRAAHRDPKASLAHGHHNLAPATGTQVAHFAAAACPAWHLRWADATAPLDGHPYPEFVAYEPATERCALPASDRVERLDDSLAASPSENQDPKARPDLRSAVHRDHRDQQASESKALPA